MPKKIDLTGQRFGRLVVLKDIGRDKHGFVLWLCQCECGTQTKTISINLRNGGARGCKSCGYDGHIIHGHARNYIQSPTYKSWYSMLSRCNNPNTAYYKYYGGRGITVTERWRSFPNFLADMGERPPRHTIDRTDNNGNYEPNNCRWVTPKEQAENRRPPPKRKH